MIHGNLCPCARCSMSAQVIGFTPSPEFEPPMMSLDSMEFVTGGVIDGSKIHTGELQVGWVAAKPPKDRYEVRTLLEDLEYGIYDTDTDVFVQKVPLSLEDANRICGEWNRTIQETPPFSPDLEIVQCEEFSTFKFYTVMCCIVALIMFLAFGAFELIVRLT